MTAIHDTLQALRCGAAQYFSNLALVPLLTPAPRAAAYITLADALAQDLAFLDEVNEAGEVPVVRCENRGERPLLLLDGEEVQGAKQDRVFNLTVLLPARTRCDVPVSCVEQGRWSRREPGFRASGRTLHASARAAKARAVTASLSRGTGRGADQAALWTDVRGKLERMAVRSESGALGDAYAHFAEAVEAYVEGFSVEAAQTGALFAINGRVCGVECFDAPEVFAKLFPVILRGYALDAIDHWRADAAPLAAGVGAAVLARVAACPTRRRRALGLGNEYRFEGTDIAGGALVLRDVPLHLCAFLDQADSAATAAPSSR
jgi:hypothetical protein